MLSRVLAAIAGLALGLAVGNAQAGTVTSATPVDFTFDVPFAQSFNAFSYSCGLVCDGTDLNPDWLDTDKSFGFQFGTSLGGSDLGTAWFPNPFGSPIWNAAGPLFASPGIPNDFIPVSIDISSALTLYVRVLYFDDEFVINELTIGSLVGSCVENCGVVSPPEVPLPAALPLFVGGLGVMAFLARRRKQNALAA